MLGVQPLVDLAKLTGQPLDVLFGRDNDYTIARAQQQAVETPKEMANGLDKELDKIAQSVKGKISTLEPGAKVPTNNIPLANNKKGISR